jgi:CHAT domain-containing protein
MRNVVPTFLRIAAGLLLVVLLGVAGWQFLRWRNSGSPEALLERADKMSWLNGWIEAEPLYRQAELQFTQRHQLSKALYARVSQVPANSESSSSLPSQIALLTSDLALPEARDPETRLQILTILGMLEVNYDSGMARITWGQVEVLALQRQHLLLASRAIGEQGVAAYLLGDIATAKKDVIKAWTVAKVADPAARVRYASLYGAGLVEIHKYNEALGPLDEAIRVAKKTPDAAYPTIAIMTKVEALSGLGRNQEALTLAAEAMQRVGNDHLAGHLYEMYQTRVGVYERMGQWDQAIADYVQSVRYAKQLTYWRGLTQADGYLARAYLHQGALQQALAAINESIDANKNIPDELYFVPRNLGIKAEITARLGNVKTSNDLFEKSADLFDALLSKAPTPTVERQLLNDLSEMYSGYFASLADQGRTADAFRAIERARGRVEAQALAHHEVITPHEPNPTEEHLAKLNLALLDADDPSARARILDAVYEAEQQLNADPTIRGAEPRPVALEQLQRDLRPTELLVEYVLDEPQSYGLAVTRNSVHRYALPSRNLLGQDAIRYRSEVTHQGADLGLAQRIFDEILGKIPEFKEKRDLIVVPDGKLHLLPFSALADAGHYLLTSHRVSVIPSGTVLHILRQREDLAAKDDRPYVGVAAWTTNPSQGTLLAAIRRAVSGPTRKEFVALPGSEHEVEAIAADLPQPSTILLGPHATETEFKQLPLGEFNVVHLALHGYTDPEYPDRSALVFAPEQNGTDDGLLQVREIRDLRLNANLVTLSACNTGVGPVGEEGVANIVNAFIESGAQSVVSTLWELQDHSTAQLMMEFYDHLARHEEKAEALRQAQLKMLSSGSPPFFWAGFALAGEPNGTLFREPKHNLFLRSAR